MSLAAFEFTDRVAPVIEMGIGDAHVTVTPGRWDSARWDTAGALWGGTEPTWVDVSCDVRRIQLLYGRQAITDRFVVGVADLEVDNATGWADPNAAIIPGVLTVRPGRQIRISIDHVTLGRRVLFQGWVDAM
ncbi:MAG: hypothetical protein ABWZ99_16340, partial [Ilumatobacteraceae bacterium]